MNAEKSKTLKKICSEAKIVKLYNDNGELTFTGHLFIEKALVEWPEALEEIERLNNLLNNANQALTRAGSSAQFHLKADDMPVESIVFEEKEHPEDVFIKQHIEELNQRIGRLRTEVRYLRTKNEQLQTGINKFNKTCSTLQTAKDAIAEEFNKISERLQKENIKLKSDNAAYDLNNKFLVKILFGAIRMPIAAVDVIKERQRQVAQEKFSEEHDDKYLTDELARAAIVYALPDSMRNEVLKIKNLFREFTFKDYLWPFNEKWWKPSPDNRRRELVKAAALIIAEIERLDRKWKLKVEFLKDAGIKESEGAK